MCRDVIKRITVTSYIFIKAKTRNYLSSLLVLSPNLCCLIRESLCLFLSLKLLQDPQFEDALDYTVSTDADIYVVPAASHLRKQAAT